MRVVGIYAFLVCAFLMCSLRRVSFPGVPVAHELWLRDTHTAADVLFVTEASGVVVDTEFSAPLRADDRLGRGKAFVIVGAYHAAKEVRYYVNGGPMRFMILSCWATAEDLAAQLAVELAVSCARVRVSRGGVVLGPGESVHVPRGIFTVAIGTPDGDWLRAVARNSHGHMRLAAK